MKNKAFISAKKEYVKILKEEQLVYDTFVAPFKRLFTAIKLTAKTVLNVAGLAWGTFTLSPKKMKEARSRFESRQSEIESEWKPIIDESEKYLGSGEAALAALMFAPTATITAVAAKAGFQGTVGTLDQLNKSGLKIPLISKVSSALSGNDFSVDQGGSGSSGGKKDDRSLLQKIAGLFYIESSWLEGDLITEKTEKKFGVEDFKKELPVWLKSTGIESKIQESSKEYFLAFEDSVNDIVDEAKIKISLLKSMSKMESFDQANKMMTSSGIDSSKIMQDLNKSKEEVMKDKGFIKGVPKELKKENPTEEEISLEAEKAVLKTSITRIEQIKSDAKNQIDLYFPKDLNMSIIESTKAGKKFIELFEKAKLNVSNA